MEAANQTETQSPTPEQLLTLLDLQLKQERSKRAGKSRNRATFLSVGIVFIIAAAGIALIVAERLLFEFRERGSGEPLAGQVEDDR